MNMNPDTMFQLPGKDQIQKNSQKWSSFLYGCY